MRKPSDYAHAYGEPVPSRGGDVPVDALWEPLDPAPEAMPATPGEAPADAAGGVPEGMELATFRLLYESGRLCLFETRDGHLTAIDVKRLA